MINISNTVKTIDSFVFSGCSSLTFVEIPNSVTSIRIRAFDSCENLEKVKFADTIIWYIGFLEEEMADEISSPDLANESIAAIYLKDTCKDKCWTKQ